MGGTGVRFGCRIEVCVWVVTGKDLYVDVGV